MIVLLETVHVDALALLRQADDVRLTAVPTALDADVPRHEVRAVLTRGRGRITDDWFRHLPNLAVVGRCGAGLDNIDTAAAHRSGVAVVHAPGSTTGAVSEHAVMLMLALARRLSVLDGAAKQGRWADRDGYEGIELAGKRLGIVGLGAIGLRVADLGVALGMDVVCWSRTSRHPTVPWSPLDELLSTADVIQLCVASTPQTHHLVGRDELARMKPGVLLVNTARGGLVDHQALSRALAAREVGGYAADVWDPEPPAIGDPLLADDRVLVTPHVAGLTDVTYREICMRPARAAVAILAGEQPDPATVYLSE